MPTDTFFNLKQEKQDRITKASIKEFADHSYKEAKLSRIIKEAKIPRGSFYQYFNDKADLYKYIFTVITNEKLQYLGTDVTNPDEIPFIELFRKLYTAGIRFATDNPDYIRITRHLMNSRGLDIFKEIIGDGMEQGKQYYKSYIEIDKKHGRIRKDVDSGVLADIILESSITISFVDLTKPGEYDIERSFHRMEQFLLILQKGIEKV